MSVLLPAKGLRGSSRSAPEREPKHPLLDQIHHRMLDQLLVPIIVEAPREFHQQAGPRFDLAERQPARIGSDRSPSKSATTCRGPRDWNSNASWLHSVFIAEKREFFSSLLVLATERLSNSVVQKPVNHRRRGGGGRRFYSLIVESLPFCWLWLRSSFIRKVMALQSWRTASTGLLCWAAATLRCSSS